MARRDPNDVVSRACHPWTSPLGSPIPNEARRYAPPGRRDSGQPMWIAEGQVADRYSLSLWL
jgi:hypothetical protein